MQHMRKDQKTLKHVIVQLHVSLDCKIKNLVFKRSSFCSIHCLQNFNISGSKPFRLFSSCFNVLQQSRMMT